MSETAIIRQASPADAGELAGMHVASWRETYAGVIPDAMLAGLSVERRAAMWSKILSAPEGVGQTSVYIAEIDCQIAGFGSCGGQRTAELRQQGYAGEVSAIYVLQAFQRRTLGRKLLHALASDLSVRGFTAASLWVLRENQAARGFYERYGAQVIAEREDARPEGILYEVAYGWQSLVELTRSTAQRG